VVYHATQTLELASVVYFVLDLEIPVTALRFTLPHTHLIIFILLLSNYSNNLQ
jgi:hypothetical protein